MENSNFAYNTKEIYNKKEVFINQFEDVLYKKRKNNNYTELVILCIGTDKITGDCFGPLVGSFLIKLFENYNIFNISIYGTLENNINYNNIDKILKRIYKIHQNPCIVVVDAALSKKENIGKIYVSDEKTILGKSLNKNNLLIGDISIKAVVGKDYKLAKYNFVNLQNISLNVVMNLANIVSEGIFEIIKYS